MLCRGSDVLTVRHPLPIPHAAAISLPVPCTEQDSCFAGQRDGSAVPRAVGRADRHSLGCTDKLSLPASVLATVEPGLTHSLDIAAFSTPISGPDTTPVAVSDSAAIAAADINAHRQPVCCAVTHAFIRTKRIPNDRKANSAPNNIRPHDGMA